MAVANLQTVIVSKTVAKTRAKAERLARPHANRIYTSRETSHSWRFRQRPPSDFKKRSFRTFHLPGSPGITLVYGDLKRSKNPKGGKVLAGRQRHLQHVGKDGVEDINRDWDFWLEIQRKIAGAKDENMIQVLALSTRRRRIQSVTVKDLIIGALADRARELRVLRTRPGPSNDERYYNRLVGDNPKRKAKKKAAKKKVSKVGLKIKWKKSGPDYGSQSFSTAGGRKFQIAAQKVGRGRYILTAGTWRGDVYQDPDYAYQDTYGYPLKKVKADAQRILDAGLYKKGRSPIPEDFFDEDDKLLSSSPKRAAKKNPATLKRIDKHYKKKARASTRSKARKPRRDTTSRSKGKKKKKISRAQKLKAPKVMPDPGPSAWCGSTLEFAIKPNGKKPKWAKVCEEGNWLWNGGMKKEWLFLWSPKYKAVVAIRRPRGLKGGPGKFPGKGEVIRDGGGARMFEVFASRPAEQTQEVELDECPLVKAGDAVNIVYRADKWSKSRKTTDYIHDFKKGVQLYCGPTLSNPQVFLCFGGKLTMTERGLVF